MHEVEVKARLRDPEALIRRLREAGSELGPQIVQEDTVYARDVDSTERYLANSAFLRLRVEDSGKVFFAYKHHAGRARDLTSSPLEIETEVGSRDDLERILLLMGYQEAVRVTKRRRKGRYEDCEVCIDDVEGLGLFVELEELTADANDIPRVKERLAALLETLGIPPEDHTDGRYDVLILETRT